MVLLVAALLIWVFAIWSFASTLRISYHPLRLWPSLQQSLAEGLGVGQVVPALLMLALIVATPLLIWNLLEEMPKATIAQIHGGCIGGAFELALAADFRVMAEDAVAGIVEVRVGLIPDVGGCSRLPAVVGLGNAKELIMTGKLIDGREAHRIGFANRIAPADELDRATQALCDELLACAPQAVGLAKRVLDHAAKPAFAQTLEHEVTVQQQLARTEDFAEATRAFFEKRQPEFTGR